MFNHNIKSKSKIMNKYQIKAINKLDIRSYLKLKKILNKVLKETELSSINSNIPSMFSEDFKENINNKEYITRYFKMASLSYDLDENEIDFLCLQISNISELIKDKSTIVKYEIIIRGISEVFIEFWLSKIEKEVVEERDEVLIELLKNSSIDSLSIGDYLYLKKYL